MLPCGALSSAYYLAVNAYVPTRCEGYSVASQVVSELSAIGSPTRALWVRLMLPHTILLAAFGTGVLMSAGGHRALKVGGGLLAVNAAIGLFWPPMHMRGVEPTLTDTLHIAFAMVWLVVMLLAMGLAASALGGGFRRYTLATIAVFVVFGILTALDGPGIPAGLPTPHIGIWERINMAAGMLWLAALGIALLGPQVENADADRGTVG